MWGTTEPATDPKLRKDDRIFVLRPIDGKRPSSSTGLVDTRLFTGGNVLHAKMDPQNCLWYMEYENGVLPQALKGRYTKFRDLREYVENYFRTRNIEIVEVKD